MAEKKRARKEDNPDPVEGPAQESSPDVEGSAPDESAVYWKAEAARLRGLAGGHNHRCNQAEKELVKLKEEFQRAAQRWQGLHKKGMESLLCVAELWSDAKHEFEKAMLPTTLSIPLGDGKYFKIRPPCNLTDEDVEILIETLKLWRSRMVSGAKGNPSLTPKAILERVEAKMEAALEVEEEPDEGVNDESEPPAET